MTDTSSATLPAPSRRGFLEASAVTVGGALAATLPLAGNVHAAGSDLLRIGPDRLRQPGHGGSGAGAAPPTRTSSSSPWATPSRTAWRKASAS